jgi:hypothetical protein
MRMPLVGGICCIAQFTASNNKIMMSSHRKMCSKLYLLTHPSSTAGALLVPDRRALAFRIRYSSCRNGTSSIDDTNPVRVHFYRNRPLQESYRHIDLMLIPNPSKDSFETTQRSRL